MKQVVRKLSDSLNRRWSILYNGTTFVTSPFLPTSTHFTRFYLLLVNNDGKKWKKNYNHKYYDGKIKLRRINTYTRSLFPHPVESVAAYSVIQRCRKNRERGLGWGRGYGDGWAPVNYKRTTVLAGNQSRRNNRFCL